MEKLNVRGILRLDWLFRAHCWFIALPWVI